MVEWQTHQFQKLALQDVSVQVRLDVPIFYVDLVFFFHSLFTGLFVPNNHVSLAHNNDSHGSREVLAEYNNLQDCGGRTGFYVYLLKPGTLHCISADNKILSTKVFGDDGK